MQATIADLNAYFEHDTWDRTQFLELQQAAFAGGDSFDKFRRALQDTVREAQGTGPKSKSAALKAGLAAMLVGDTSHAIATMQRASASPMRDYYLGCCLREAARHDEALQAFEQAAAAGWDPIECASERADTLIRMGRDVEAEKLLSTVRVNNEVATVHHAYGRLHEARGEVEQAISRYEQAIAIEPDNATYLFRLAFVSDLHGDDQRALELYKSCAEAPTVSANALVNLSVMYEDLGEYEEAAGCLQRVLAANPNHARAGLFLKDVQASFEMYIDEEQERVRAERLAVLDIPVTDFELSVRARNCLKKMNINSLGDLLRTTESELLSYKNFGETSLNEIKAMLLQKGLSLGQLPEGMPRPRVEQRTPPPGNLEIYGRPVAELELSVRSRKCLQRLAIVSVGDLCTRTEQELLATRNFGQTSLNEIKRRLSELGLSLRQVGE